MVLRLRFRRGCLRCLGPIMVAIFLLSSCVFFLGVPSSSLADKLQQFQPVGKPGAQELDNIRKQGLISAVASQIHALEKIQNGQKQLVENERKKRQNLIVVAHGRSGSSFTGNIFNYHPSVFYLFEPYQTVERLHGRVAPFNRDYQEKSFEWMQGVFRCKFVSPKHAKDIEHYYRTVTRNYPRDEQASIALSSPPFCRYNVTDPRWNIKDCRGAFDQKTLEEICEKKYSMTVVKALMVRMPNNSVGQLINVCDSSDDIDCKLLFVVRDPRGIVPSSKVANFYRETDKNGLTGTKKFAYENCRQTEFNLNTTKQLPPKWRNRVKLLRFEDLSANPSKILPGLLQFAGLPMDEAVSNWLYLASHKPETEREQKAAKWRQDSAERANRWRLKASPDEISIVERYCGRLMKVLGYKPLGNSFELQKNLSVALYNDNFEAVRWFE
ncbi:carbohydrate sulfotransferase 1-like [Orbicella faveolata]|uniref:carbohydrate sulfotransferase 1-like n=1 Tax=Orbicella faveolata TaxID=48498 RepID=UPI0009E2158C|nr:carbohydrate sulfotransferase 1-like [Orbicella faveolata]